MFRSELSLSSVFPTKNTDLKDILNILPSDTKLVDVKVSSYLLSTFYLIFESADFISPLSLTGSSGSILELNYNTFGQVESVTNIMTSGPKRKTKTFTPMNRSPREVEQISSAAGWVDLNSSGTQLPVGNSSAPQKTCWMHDRVTYTGVVFSYDYCKKCGEKLP